MNAFDALRPLMTAADARALTQRGIRESSDFADLMEPGILETVIPASAPRVRAVMSAAVDISAAKRLPKQFKSPKEIGDFFQPRMAHLSQEHMFAVYLTAENRTIGSEKLIGIGTSDQCLAEPRDIYREAIARGATNVVILHNHPDASSAVPSPADLKATMRLAQAGALIGVNLLDHIVVAQSDHTSIALFLDYLMTKQQQQQQQGG